MSLLPPVTGTFDDQQPAMHSQAGISVGHENLRGGRDVRYLH